MSGMRKMAAASAVVAASAALLTGCQTTDAEDMPAIGTPNPASVWCMEKGGRLEIVKDKDGNESGLCVLPTGERVDEWTLFRRDHKN